MASIQPLEWGIERGAGPQKRRTQPGCPLLMPCVARSECVPSICLYLFSSKRVNGTLSHSTDGHHLHTDTRNVSHPLLPALRAHDATSACRSDAHAGNAWCLHRNLFERHATRRILSLAQKQPQSATARPPHHQPRTQRSLLPCTCFALRIKFASPHTCTHCRNRPRDPPPVSYLTLSGSGPAPIGSLLQRFCSALPNLLWGRTQVPALAYRPVFCTPDIELYRAPTSASNHEYCRPHTHLAHHQHSWPLASRIVASPECRRLPPAPASVRHHSVRYEAGTAKKSLSIINPLA